MVNVRRLRVVALALLSVSACQAPPGPTAPATPTPAAVQEPALRRIELTRGDSISTSVDVEGKSAVEVTVAAGKTGAGTYTSRDGTLLDLAREAANSLNEPGVKVAIEVDVKGALVSLEHSVTR